MDVRAQQPIAPPANPSRSDPSQPSNPAATPPPGTPAPTRAHRSLFDAIGDFFKGIGDAIAKAFTNHGQDTLEQGRTPGEIGAESIRVPPPTDTGRAMLQPEKLDAKKKH